jgi:nucleoside-diphosphate-sugar epimerase
MQTILGSGGAIGIDLARALTAYTTDIRLVSRNPKKVNDTDQLFPADLTDSKQVSTAIKGSEVVYLCVGLEYKLSVWQEKWPPLMKAVIDGCVEHGAKLVFFDNVYSIGGDNVRHITETSPISPVSKKGEVRAALDQMILDAIEKRKLNAIIARAADFYSAFGDKSLIIEMIHKNLKKGKKAQWLGRSDVKHSFTYTPDAAKGTAMLGNTPDAYNQIWNLPTDPNPITAQQWVNLFAAEMGKSQTKMMVLGKFGLKLIGVFVPVLREFNEMFYQFDRDYFFDSSKFNKRFQFTPTTPAQGVKEVVKVLGK